MERGGLGGISRGGENSSIIEKKGRGLETPKGKYIFQKSKSHSCLNIVLGDLCNHVCAAMVLSFGLKKSRGSTTSFPAPPQLIPRKKIAKKEEEEKKWSGDWRETVVLVGPKC